MNITELEKLKADLNAQKQTLNVLVSGFKNNIESLCSDKDINNKLRKILALSLKGVSPDFNEIKNILEDADRIDNPK